MTSEIRHVKTGNWVVICRLSDSVIYFLLYFQPRFLEQKHGFPLLCTTWNEGNAYFQPVTFQSFLIWAICVVIHQRVFSWNQLWISLTIGYPLLDTRIKISPDEIWQQVLRWFSPVIHGEFTYRELFGKRHRKLDWTTQDFVADLDPQTFHFFLWKINKPEKNNEIRSVWHENMTFKNIKFWKPVIFNDILMTS